MFLRQDLINQDLEMVWNKLVEINAKRLLIQNIYIPPNKTEQMYVHVLDRFLEDQRDKAIIILGDLNAQNTLCNKHINQNNEMGIALEELIQRHSLCSHRFRSYLPALPKLSQLWQKHHRSYSLMEITTSLLKQGKLTILKPDIRPLKLIQKI